MASIRFFALLVSLALLSTFSCSTQFSDKLDRKVALTLLRENADALLYDERPICRPFPGLGAPGRVKIAITDITDDLTKMLNQDQQENLAICEAFESEGILRKVQITTEISAGIFSRIRRKWYLYDIVSKEDLR
jgi:hypothetical protein